MASAKRTKKSGSTAPKKRAKKALHRSDPDFFSTVGSLGGKQTLKIKGSDFFSKIARDRHQRNRDSKLAGRKSEENNTSR